MNTMTHGGYTAHVEFEGRDNIFVGRILGLRSIVSFHGQTVEQLRSEFAAAVNDYLRDCEEQGVKPEVPASGKPIIELFGKLEWQDSYNYKAERSRRRP